MAKPEGKVTSQVLGVVMRVDPCGYMWLCIAGDTQEHTAQKGWPVSILEGFQGQLKQGRD